MRQLQLCFWILLGFITATRAQQAPLPDIAVAALYRACVEGDLNQVKALVEAGAPVNGQTGGAGYTPLIASAAGHFDILNYLISRHANLDFPDYQGSTALIWACYYDKTDIALALINAGANVNAPTLTGRTPIMYAAMRGNDQIAAALIAHKANVNANGAEGTAVLWAAINDKLTTLKLLVAAGAKLDFKLEGPLGAESILGRAAGRNDLDMVNFLVDQKLDVNVPGNTGFTPLMAAVNYHSVQTLDRLLQLGAKVDAQNDAGSTALMMTNAADTTQTLLQHRANTEIKNKKGMTALMFAAWSNNSARVNSLLGAGADINATDIRGETALTIAGDVGDTDMVQLLKNRGAVRTDVHVIAKDAPTETLSAAQNWALALGAIFAQREGSNPKVLGGEDLTGFYQRVLNTSWKIDDKAGFLKALNALIDGAHGIISQNAMNKASPLNEHADTRYSGNSASMTSEITAVGARDPMDFHPTATLPSNKSSTTNFLNNGTDRMGLAWALCRSVSLINAGFAAHYISEEDAWDRLMEIARLAQAHFGSWQELSDNFLDNRQIWIRNDPRYGSCVKLLLNPDDPNSPWNQNPWKTDLSGPTN